MVKLRDALDRVEGLNYSLSANDITLWVTGGSAGHIQDTLQTAIYAVENHVMPRGLMCSPQKPELLLYQPTWRGRHHALEGKKIDLFLNMV
ncbi:hypothetical protein HPB47_003744 [Ixodes persulcatus]|uniref:Uncharacterized protein n=1 Tax=Ixodes persulcatus TaxID=34615 RepID=A0AC60PIR6_IXOPE|nr:hypothetical protein HPB47_003744 [Ixodes persulcatus]